MKIKSAIIALACVCAAELHAGVTSIDYNTGFTNPTTVITSNQPIAPISSASGVSILNPNMFHFPGDIENYNPFTQGFGGSVTLDLPSQADKFGLEVGSNSGGSDLFTIDFNLGQNLVGSTNFVMPAGNPANPIAMAFSSTFNFDSVTLVAPVNGFMRITDDSIKYEAVQSVPESLDMFATLAVMLGALAWFESRRRRSVTAA